MQKVYSLYCTRRMDWLEGKVNLWLRYIQWHNTVYKHENHLG